MAPIGCVSRLVAMVAPKECQVTHSMLCSVAVGTLEVATRGLEASNSQFLEALPLNNQADAKPLMTPIYELIVWHCEPYK